MNTIYSRATSALASTLFVLLLVNSSNAASIPAYQVFAGQDGSQGFGGELAMHFIVNSPITVTSLGAFDADSDGITGPLTTELWSRNGGAGVTMLASDTFTAASPGALIGGSRFKPIAAPVVLNPG